MIYKSHQVPLPRSIIVAATLVSVCAIGAILSWAQAVLVPLTLAAFITFLLAPFVLRLQAAGFPRVLAVLTVVASGCVMAGLGGWMAMSQLIEFTEQLPKYGQNIHEKVSDLQQWRKGGLIDRVSGVVEDVARELDGPKSPSKPGMFHKESIPVVVEEKSPIPPEVSALAWNMLERLGTAGLVLVLVVFMLLQREDLRNRAVSFAGRSYLAVTTTALDDAGRRISRYLLMQLLVNVGFGSILCLGLLVLRVPYPILWGALAAVLRYIPYVGPWIAAVLPVLLSAVVFKGWSTPLLVIGIFLTLELVANNALEPRLYGHTIGVSEVSLMICAVFWAWLWGPIGLILATPLTVCLVVLGQYVPALSFFNRLLGDKPMLDAHLSFYQRLLAHDDDEAEDVLERFVARNSLDAAGDALLIPALEMAKLDHERGDLSDEQEAYVAEAVIELADTAKGQAVAESVVDEGVAAVPLERSKVIGFGVRGRMDRAALEVFARHLPSHRCDFEVLSEDVLISELIAAVRETQPAVLCLASLAPDGITHAKHLCRRLRAACPEVKLLFGRWGMQGLREKARTALDSAGVDFVSSTLQESRTQLHSLLQISGSGSVGRSMPPVSRCPEPQTV